MDKTPPKITKTERSFHQMNDTLMDISRLFIRQHNRMQDFGVRSRLCRAEIHTIQAIGHDEGVNLTALARRLGVSKPTVSARVKKLIGLKLVKKESPAGNKKEIRLRLTAKGWTAYENHEKQHRDMYALFKKHFGRDAAAFLELFAGNLDRFHDFLRSVQRSTQHFQ